MIKLYKIIKGEVIMTEEEFKNTMGKIIIFIVIALIILVIIGVLVFNKSGKSLSIFSNEKEKNSYKKSVQEANSSNVTVDKSSTEIDNQEENVIQNEVESETTENVETNVAISETPVENEVSEQLQ